MSQKHPSVLGIDVPPPRPTFRGALWLACSLSALAVPLLLMLEYALRWLL